MWNFENCVVFAWIDIIYVASVQVCTEIGLKQRIASICDDQ